MGSIPRNIRIPDDINPERVPLVLAEIVNIYTENLKSLKTKTNNPKARHSKLMEYKEEIEDKVINHIKSRIGALRKDEKCRLMKYMYPKYDEFDHVFHDTPERSFNRFEYDSSYINEDNSLVEKMFHGEDGDPDKNLLDTENYLIFKKLYRKLLPLVRKRRVQLRGEWVEKYKKKYTVIVPGIAKARVKKSGKRLSLRIPEKQWQQLQKIADVCSISRSDFIYNVLSISENDSDYAQSLNNILNRYLAFRKSRGPAEVMSPKINPFSLYRIEVFLKTYKPNLPDNDEVLSTACPEIWFSYRSLVLKCFRDLKKFREVLFQRIMGIPHP